MRGKQEWTIRKTLETSGTQEAWRTKTHKSENQTDEQRGPHQKPGVNPDVHEG